MIVSIARELGAGGFSVGEAVAETINAELLDERSIIEALSSRLGYPPTWVAERLERPPRVSDRLIVDLAAATAMLPFTESWQPPEEALVEAVRALVLERAAHGNVVVIGHGGVSLLGFRPAEHAVFALLLRAGRPWRVAQLARRYGIDEEEAERRIARTDEARQRFQKHYFNSDLYDARQYDLVLCTETLGLERAVALSRALAAQIAAEAPAIR